MRGEMILKAIIFITFIVTFFSGCSSASSDFCITAFDCEEGEICRQGECVEGTAGDTGNSGDASNTGIIGDTGDTGNSGDSGNSGDTGDSGNSGNSGNDIDAQNDFDDNFLNEDVIPGDADFNDDDVIVCGNEATEEGEECDNGENNTMPGYSESQVCNTECVWNPFCGDTTVDYKDAQFAEDAVVLRLDGESLTEAVDSSSNGLACTIENAVRVDGKFGRALSFSGTCSYDTESEWVCENNGRVYWSYGTVPTDNFTMMAWVKAIDEHEIDEESNTGTSGTKGQRYVFGANHGQEFAGAGLSVGTNGISVYEHGTAYMSALAVYETGLGTGWNHVTVVYTERQPSIYLNGKLVKTGLVSARATVNAPTSVGSGNYGNFNGSVDEVRIVARSLTEEEIRVAMGEVCDEGDSNAAVAYGSAVCNTDCMINAYCGDGILDSGETCDEGVFNGTEAKCKSDCSGYDCIPGTYTFEYTGAQQTWTVPGPGTYTIETWGGQGKNNQEGNVAGGLGGYSKATVPMTTGDILYIYAGQGGGSGTAASFNGGGAGGTSSCVNAQGGAGGGASDVRKNGNALTDRVIVAGGGGGAGGNRKKSCGPGAGGGGGGGYFGGGGGGAYKPTTVAIGGSQSAGGAGGLGQFGGENGTNGDTGLGGKGGNAPDSPQGDNNNAHVGGTGGGNTGGNGLIHSDTWTGGSGAGGSGFVNAPGNTDGSMQNGVRTGNGRVVITRTCP